MGLSRSCLELGLHVAEFRVTGQTVDELLAVQLLKLGAVVAHAVVDREHAHLLVLRWTGSAQTSVITGKGG